MTEVHIIHGRRHAIDTQLRPNGGYDKNDPDTFLLQYSPETESVAEAIVKGAAFVHNVEHDELSPLAHTIDPDALDKIIGPNSTNPSKEVELTFEYEDLQITVNNSQDIWLQWL